MLIKLSISNFVIIQHTTIHFVHDLNIITGETGAGKSILMDALGLLLGNRIETNYCFDKNKKCILEADFSLMPNNELSSLLKTMDIDFTEELILRREISPNNKSRMFINDGLITIQMLKKITPFLMDIHQQFDTLQLTEEFFQRKVIDSVAQNNALLTQFQQEYNEYILIKNKLQTLQQNQITLHESNLLKSFLYTEIEELQLKENELEDLENELRLLENGEFIKKQINSVTLLLTESESPIIPQFKLAIQHLQSISKWEKDMPILIQRLQSVLIETADISAELNTISNHIQLSNERIEIIHDRISKGFKLLKKHQVKTTAELLTLQQKLKNELVSNENIAEQIAALEKELKILETSVFNLATKISENRKNAVPPFTKKLHQLLQEIGMSNASIQINIKPTILDKFGMDEIEFLFDSNKKNEYISIKKIASGGELSRLMLCIKTILSVYQNLPTLIFDEIDSGVSGESAKRIAHILIELSKKNQLICITHLPQIASKGNYHLKVFKEINNNIITSNVEVLNKESRIQVIAEMISGINPTANALKNAAEMLAEN